MRETIVHCDRCERKQNNVWVLIVPAGLHSSPAQLDLCADCLEAVRRFAKGQS